MIIKKGLVKMKNNYTIEEVANILYELFDDFCACNYCNNDEWLPYVCDYRDECPLEETKENKYTCWLQMIKHYDDKKSILER